MDCKPARTISVCAGRCSGCKRPVDWRERLLQASRAVSPVLREVPVRVVQAEVVPGAVVDSAVDVEAADSAEDAAVAGSAGREVSVDGREATAGSLAIARIAAAREFMAICRSNGRAPTPTPSSSR